jgi:putative ABC transport system permease protein
MWKVTIKGLLSRKLRVVLTAIAIVLGVTFVTGTLILTDTLHNTFTGLLTTAYGKIDFQVRSDAQFGTSGLTAIRNPLTESLLTKVEQVPGVEAADGLVGGYAQFIAPDGKPITSGSAPTAGLNWDPNPNLNALHIVSGSPPTGPDDVVMDQATAQKYNFKVGQQVRILFAGPPRTFTISGIAEIGTAGNLAGETIAAFTEATAQQVLDLPGQFNDIDILATPGANKAAVQSAIAKVLPPGIQVVTGQTVISEDVSSVDQDLGFLNTALLVFAFIALFVGGFTILNTFAIIVGQRTKELALLRIVGASRRQVFRAVIGEAALTGLIASLIGIGLGALTALGLVALLRGFGVSLPSAPLVFSARTIIVGLAVGIGVTVISAISPARRAVRIPPIAAITELPADDTTQSRRRLIGGSALGLIGIIALAAGLAKPAVILVAVGAACIFIAAAVLSASLARPLSAIIGRPLAGGISGKLGRENSMRNPRRTARTASALMVGMALVATVSVFGASVSKSATNSVDSAISASLLVTSANNSAQVSDTVPAITAAVPGVTAESTVYAGQFEFQGNQQTLVAVPPGSLASTVILHFTAGGASALADGELLIDTTTANNDHLTVGDTVPVVFAATGAGTMRIGAIYQANALAGSYITGNSFFLAHFPRATPDAVLLATNGSTAVTNAVTSALAAYPNVQVQTRAQYEKAQAASINELLGLVYALLALAIIIALIGIVNTLMLSVFERTREIGLLRAVGMQRVQVRRMIRSESVILSVFGAIIGIIIGTALGIALVQALKPGISVTVVPVSSLVIFLILSGLLGLLAATWPSRRAAKLDVLAAIATN